MTYNDLLEDESIPAEEDPETLDVRDLPPPKPLQRTLEELQSLPNDGVLVQINDRVPQHLFEQLTERGYAYRTADGEPVYTAIWRERD